MNTQFRTFLAEACEALLAHRLRSSLSVLGIVCGVATVVTAVAIGEGARDAALAEIGSLGIDNVFVRAVAPAGERPGQSLAPTLSVGDARAVAAAVSGLVAEASLRIWRGEAAADGRVTPMSLVGVDPAWSEVGRPVLANGRWLSAEDASARRRVAVLGSNLAVMLFGVKRPIGQRLSVAGTWFTVVGVIDGGGTGTQSSSRTFDPDHTAFVPFEAMDIGLGHGDAADRVTEIALAFGGAAAVERAVPVIIHALSRQRVEQDQYQLVVPRELLRARLRAQRTFDAVLLAIGALALAISGVGIMNIMLASVAERTQEIGVRRAFGARRREVVVQFACEAGLLAGFGGAAGVALGWAMAEAVAAFAGWPTSLSWSAVVLALALAIGVGLGFGIYPARVASRIEPAEALRAP